MKSWRTIGIATLVGAIVASFAWAAAPGIINQYNALCDPKSATHCAAPDASGNLPVTATLSGTSDVNLKQVNGATTTAFGSGVTGTETQRVTLATDVNVPENIAQVAGATVATGHGTAAGSLRVELPTDGTGVVGLAAGAAVIGHVVTDSGSITSGNVTAADGAVLTNALKTWSVLGTYNGTTEDLGRSIITGTNSTGTGIVAAGTVGQCDDTSPQAITENQFGNARIGCADHAQLAGGISSAGVVTGAVSGDVNNVAAATGYLDAFAVARYNATLPTITDTRFNGLQVGSRGSLHAELWGSDAATAVNVGTAADDATLTGALRTYAINGIYDGTTIDLMREVTNSMNTTGAGIPVAAAAGQCDDTSPTAISENSWGNGRIDCSTHALGEWKVPTAAASAGIPAVVSSSLETGHVLKNAAGNLYGVELTTTTAAGYLLVFNATAVPAAGAVTPVASCYAGAFGTCTLNFDPPLVLSTGISAAFSISATPFTKTDSATAMISGQVM